MANKKKMWITLIAIAMIMLIGGNWMAIIKEVGQIGESLAQKFPSEEEKRRRIALWVVQHYEGPEPIKTTEVGKIKTHGIFGSGGSSVSVVINSKKKNMIEGIGVDEKGNPTSAGLSFEDGDYKYVKEKLSNKTLDGINILYWEEENDTRFK